MEYGGQMSGMETQRRQRIDRVSSRGREGKRGEVWLHAA